MFRFRITTLLLLVLAVSIAAGWLVDRQRLLNRIDEQNPPISNYGEKFSYWSPAGYVDGDTASYETRLSDRIEFEGKMITSSQGMGSPTIRQPTVATLDNTLALLDSDDGAIRLCAAQLIALYLQAVSGSGNLDSDSVATRVHFQAVGLPKVRNLLKDENPKIRGASALILGNSLYDRHTVSLMTEAFDRETDQSVKLRLAWAYWKIGHNYDKAGFYTD